MPSSQRCMASGNWLAPAIGDVYSQTLYTGNGATQSVSSVDLSTNGGMTLIKNRSNARKSIIFDTDRGATKYISSNSATSEATGISTLTAFGTTDVTMGSSIGNLNTETYVAWSFAKHPRFFDVVTYSGAASNQTLRHNLHQGVGMMWVKRLDTGSNSWVCYHRSLGATKHIVLDTSGGQATYTPMWNDTEPNSGEFTVGTDGRVNTSGGTYVCYLFAHDAVGVIDCGTYTGNGSSTGPTISLGFAPQMVLIKNATNGSTDWVIHDSARDASNPRTEYLEPNNVDAEATGRDVDFNASDFQIKSTDSAVNTNTDTYIYMAISA